MLELLAAYSVEQIIVFIIMLCFAVKGIIDFIDWAKKKYQDKFNRDHNALTKQTELEQHYQKCLDQHNESVSNYQKLENKLDNVTGLVENLSHKIEDLGTNDKHIIKQTLVKDYHYFKRLGYIDHYSLDTILLLFEDYKALGGNSYIEDLISELRKLPNEKSE